MRTSRFGFLGRAKNFIVLFVALFTYFAARLCSSFVDLEPDVVRLRCSSVRYEPDIANGVNAGDLEWAVKPTERESGEPRRQLVFAGVMTAEKYLENRAASVYRTWGQSIPGRVVFFSSATSKAPGPEFPLVTLPGVDDSYPPQKKSFLMLKYMYDNFLDNYEWFMRADDDVYVRGDRLEEFLASLNSSKPLFIGQAGMGNKEEFGMLNLAAGENFCMGGPGIIMSRETLRLVAPNIQYCLKHLYSTHEDVEVGRCIRKFAGVPCAWSYEMQTIFYHNQSGAAAFTSDLHVKEVHRAITLHPVKTSLHLHRIQNYYAAQSLATLHHEILLLQREIRDMNEYLDLKSHSASSEDAPHRSLPDLNRFHPRSPDEVLEWEFFTKSFFSHRDYNPKRGLKNSLKWALNDLVMQLMDHINQYSKQRGRIIDFKVPMSPSRVRIIWETKNVVHEFGGLAKHVKYPPLLKPKDLLYGYQRLDPLHGVQYVLDLHLVYKRYSGRKITAPVRRHAYLQQAFSWLELTEETDCVGESPTTYDLKRDFSDTLRYFAEKPHLSEFLDHTDTVCPKPVSSEVVNLILPLSGRVSALSRFLTMLDEKFFSQGDAISLTVVDFAEGVGDTDRQRIRSLIDEKKQKFGRFRIDRVELGGNFSRAVALQTGSSRFMPESLLFFVDVDMMFDRGYLQRVRQNTKLGRMVFYPVVFSQHAPESNEDQPIGELSVERASNCRLGYSQHQSGKLGWRSRADFCHKLVARTGLNSPDAFADHVFFTEENGYWRQFGYGIASCYRADFDSVGGFDLDIHGWGKEDVDLFEKFLQLAQRNPQFEVFRSADPGLVHVYHDVYCDSALEAPQLIMCLGSRAASMSGQQKLTRLILSNSLVLNGSLYGVLGS